MTLAKTLIQGRATLSPEMLGVASPKGGVVPQRCATPPEAQPREHLPASASQPLARRTLPPPPSSVGSAAQPAQNPTVQRGWASPRRPDSTDSSLSRTSGNASLTKSEIAHFSELENENWNSSGTGGR